MAKKEKASAKVSGKAKAPKSLVAMSEKAENALKAKAEKWVKEEAKAKAKANVKIAPSPDDPLHQELERVERMPQALYRHPDAKEKEGVIGKEFVWKVEVTAQRPSTEARGLESFTLPDHITSKTRVAAPSLCTVPRKVGKRDGGVGEVSGSDINNTSTTLGTPQLADKQARTWSAQKDELLLEKQKSTSDVPRCYGLPRSWLAPLQVQAGDRLCSCARACPSVGGCASVKRLQESVSTLQSAIVNIQTVTSEDITALWHDLVVGVVRDVFHMDAACMDAEWRNIGDRLAAVNCALEDRVHKGRLTLNSIKQALSHTLRPRSPLHSKCAIKCVVLFASSH
ncbi:hypothetical protein ECG_09789 [Echinococcus granulosus]|nr:hypothetical protein ECG_09789 [Echinococcus granulosus]